MNTKIWYHGTSQESYNKILKEGNLHGVHASGKRFTFLAIDKDEAKAYGEVLLRVEYDPVSDLDNNNYNPDCLDVRVVTPIATSNIQRV